MYERIVVSSSVVQGSLAVTDGNIFFLQHSTFEVITTLAPVQLY